MIRNLAFAVFVAIVLNTSSLHSLPASEENRRWMLVTTAELKAELEPLVLRRQQQGFEVVRLIRDEQIPSSDWNAETIRKRISESHESGQATFVLLVGGWDERRKEAYVPSAVGKRGRMQGASTDHAFGNPSEQGVPSVAVGRFPARTAEQVRQFVTKVARYEDQAIGPWTNRVNLWVGHPGGNSAIEKRLGESIIKSVVNKSLSQVSAAWKGSCLIDFPNTPYSVDRKTFAMRMREQLSEGQTFTIYAGHSAAEGIWSEDQFVCSREDLERVKIESSPGVVLTTGCFSCQMSGPNGIGFLTSSVLNPAGPVAGLGAYAESYAAHGQLAMDAFVGLTARPKPPTLLGEYWSSIAQGIGTGKMDPLTFQLYDQADGSRGAVPLAQQRLEHLEMWTLLGDPALRIPFLEPTLKLDVSASVGSSEVAVEFDVPESLYGSACELQVQLRSKRGVPILSPMVKIQQVDASPQMKATILGFKPLAEGELVQVRALIHKEGRGSLGIALQPIGN